ncbi:ABC transporter permease/M1 family aminopeptidase [Spongiimicrobium salis]|uniref:ABC transporter permease/M1 family aminopeptidase n=1 Tax=Spongiimicrobium salis TaxID=1667022 RepID=UPI00374D4045
MLFEIFKFEIKYRLKRPDTYGYFAILFLYAIVAVDIAFEGKLNGLKANAPTVIAKAMAISSALFMMVVSMIMGVAALRDFDHHMESLMFVNPITKKEYLFGRFLGSFVILLLVFSGLLLGMMLAPFMPWADADSFLPFNFWHYLQPFLFLVIPTLFFGGALFFVSGALSRKLMVVYVQGFAVLMIYLLSSQLIRTAENQYLGSLFDPFGRQTINVLSRYWTIAEQNINLIPLEGILGYNRLLWGVMGILILVVGYSRFKFQVNPGKKHKKKNVPKISDKEVSHSLSYPKFSGQSHPLTIFLRHSLFYFKAIVKEVPFWAIVGCAIGILFMGSINLGTSFGVNSYPVTYIVIEELLENTLVFFLLIILFYSGELIWKERDARLNAIYDALPISDSLRLSSKFTGLVLSYILLLVLMIGGGILFQSLHGYDQFELGVYLMTFFVGVFPFLVLFTVITFFFQVLVNHKFMAHFASIFIVFISVLGLRIFGFDHGLYTFGGGDLGTYSDMNAYGHFLTPYLWIKAYWGFFAILLFLLSILLSVRSPEAALKIRLKLSPLRLTKPIKNTGLVALLLFLGTGSYIFYNTNVLNDYRLVQTNNRYRAGYERTLKHLEHIPQPKIIDVNLNIDLYPSQRNYDAEGYFMLTNPHKEAISKVYIQKHPNPDSHIDVIHFEGGAIVDSTHNSYHFNGYTLSRPLQTGDTIKMTFKQRYRTKGFKERTNTSIVYNGSFFDNFSLPTIGYKEAIELEDLALRKEYGLGPKPRSFSIDNTKALKEALSKGNGEEIHFEVILSTEEDQTAIAPGYLKKQWMEGDRHYFHYKMDKPMSNFYSIVSARYEKRADQMMLSNENKNTPIDLEIYYHKGHEYNLDRMMKGMKKSLAYFNTHFSPYQYQQMRIMEFPRYRSFAQSFPNTVPFSEAIGFITDIDPQQDVDLVFYVTAHEVSHQWWGHQVNPANVQGGAMITEALAQYAALMIFRQEYPEEKTLALLENHMNRYLSGRTQESEEELPLALVESGQEYIHYGKGMVNLNAFQDYVSEDSVNVALQRFVKDWDSYTGLKKTKTENYSTTQDLLPYFREVTPDSLQYIIKDLFESVILYENKTIDATYEKLDDQRYGVSLDIKALKLKLNEKGMEETIPIGDWIDIGVYAADSEELIYLKKHHIMAQETTIDIIVSQKPGRAGIDPKHKLIDRHIEDNVIQLTPKE